MQVLAINKRVQTQNNAPPGFPNFVRQGYEIAILADDYQESDEGLIWKVHSCQHHCSPALHTCCHASMYQLHACWSTTGNSQLL